MEQKTTPPCSEWITNGKYNPPEFVGPRKSVATILTYSELKAKIDTAGGMAEFVEQLKTEGHTHIGLLPDDWATKPADFEGVRERTAEVVMAIDPTTDRETIRRFLIDQRGLRGGGSPIFMIDDAGFYRKEMSDEEVRRRMVVFTGDEFHFNFDSFPDIRPMLAEEDAAPEPKKNGPQRQSKYKRGGWWNR